MKTSITQTGHFGPAISRVVMALAAISVIGGLAVTPALADERPVYRDNGLYRGQQMRDRDRREYRPEYRRPYYYSQPVYAPPPVYYPPQQSPGISFFFPLDLRR